MSESGKKRTKRSEIYSSFPQMFKNFCSFLWVILLCFKISNLSWRRRRKPSKHKLPLHELVAKIWNFAIRRVTLSACLFLMLLCHPYRMLDSVKLTTCLNFWYHQLVNLSQKALDTLQWYSRWFIVCFSVAHREQMSLSVMPARKRLNVVYYFKLESN